MKETSGIQIIDSRTMPVRIGIAAMIVCAVAFGWFAARWQLGNMLAELTAPNDANAKDIAVAAKQLAPADPLANWLAASTKKNQFSPDIVAQTARDFESVVRLAPFDYRWWVELGRSLEQAEEYDQAERAYKRSLQLAPTYIYPRWQIGNFYLRRNRSEEAFGELKRAATADSIYRDQVFSIAWEFYDNDVNRLDAIAGDSPRVKAGLARFYAAKQRAEDAARIWNTLSAEEKAANAVYARVIGQAFYDKRLFRQSQAFFRDLGIETEGKQGAVLNGGFEQPIADVSETYFGWRFSPKDKIDIKLDPTQKHEGARSLRMSFNAFSEPAMYIFPQIVTVEAQAAYRLTFWIKTDSLKSGGPPALEVFNANDDKSIATSDFFPNGTTDWQQVKMEFTAPANAEAVGLRTIRQFCGTQCPIIGTFWYDDFKLERIK